MKDESRIIIVPKNNSKIKEIKVSRVKFISILAIVLFFTAISIKLGMDLLVDFSHNSKIKTLERTNAVLQDRLAEASDRIKVLNSSIDKIIEKDNELRTVVGLEPVSPDLWNVGIGGANYEIDFEDEFSGFEDNIGLGEKLSELAKLEREVNLALNSYEELSLTLQLKQDSLKYLPAMRPLLDGVISSGFGMRMHPILKVYRHHDGLDFGAPKGTAVYASADGAIDYAGISGGYGKFIKIDHKYGYQTRYGHLSKILVRKGEKVKRGQKIGEVGRTGLTNASHLHYEVLFKNKPVDPKLYYFDDNILNEKIANK